MSPEQFRGNPADAPSDVWALGVILYEMAACVRPFGTGDRVRAQLRQPQRSACAASAARAWPSQTVIGRCLQKELARRYQRATEVRAALEAVLAAPLAATPVRTTGRRWVVEAVPGATIVALAGGLCAASSAGFHRHALDPVIEGEENGSWGCPANHARRLVQRLEHPPADIWVDPAVVAQVYAGLGDRDRPVDWCRKGLEGRSSLMIYMKVSEIACLAPARRAASIDPMDVVRQ